MNEEQVRALLESILEEKQTKISELLETTKVNEDDELVINQNGITKKTKAKNVGTGGRR